MSFLKSEKFQKIFFSIFYAVFAIAISISGCLLFSHYYYTNIFVSGPSMMPTLVGGKGDGDRNVNHYGIADTSASAINGLKRFDVVITNYPSTWSATDGLIVKRVWGFPGETLKLTSSIEEGSKFEVYNGDKLVYTITGEYHQNQEFKFVNCYSKRTMSVFTFSTGRKIFNTNSAELRNISGYTLQENEYFLMGDNWGSSTDSYKEMIVEGKTALLTKNYIKGKVICIQGYGNVVQDGDSYKVNNKQRIRPLYNF